MRLLAILGLFTVVCALSNEKLQGWDNLNTAVNGGNGGAPYIGEMEGTQRGRAQGHTKTGGLRRGGAGIGGTGTNTMMGSEFGGNIEGGGGIGGSNAADAGNFGGMGGTDGVAQGCSNGCAAAGPDLLVLLVPVSVTLQAKPSDMQQPSTKTE